MVWLSFGIEYGLRKSKKCQFLRKLHQTIFQGIKKSSGYNNNWDVMSLNLKHYEILQLSSYLLESARFAGTI